MKAPERPRLTLVVPAGTAMAALEAALAGGSVAAAEFADGPALDQAIAAAKAAGAAALLRDRVDLVTALGADGVYLSAPDADVAAARRALGRDVLVGADAGASRHRAMIAGESGADFIAFGPLFGAHATGTATLAWWSATMVVPALARGGITLGTVADAVAAGADFIAVDAAVWDDARGPAVAIAALDQAVDRAWASC